MTNYLKDGDEEPYDAYTGPKLGDTITDTERVRVQPMIRVPRDVQALRRWAIEQAVALMGASDNAVWRWQEVINIAVEFEDYVLEGRKYDVDQAKQS